MAAGLYIASTMAGAGKTLLSFSLGVLLQRAGYRVGVMKPLGMRPVRVDGHAVDADALLVQEVLGLTCDPERVSPVFTPDSLHDLRLFSGAAGNLSRVRRAYDALAADVDVMLVMGSGVFPHTGRACHLEGLSLVRELGLSVLMVERSGEMLRLGAEFDALLSIADLLGDNLLGVVLNSVPTERMRDSRTVLSPYLREQGMRILGVIPHEAELTAIRVSELARGLSGRLLCGSESASRTVESFLIGTMQVENFMAHLGPRCAVIAGGDRADLHLAALSADCPCLVLTGNISPPEMILERARKLGTPVMLVRESTYAVARKMERILKSQKIAELGQIKRGISLVSDNVNVPHIASLLGLEIPGQSLAELV